MKRKWSPLNLKVLAYIKLGYKGKNENGGRKAVFSQSADYLKRPSHAMRWNWMLPGAPIRRSPR